MSDEEKPEEKRLTYGDLNHTALLDRVQHEHYASLKQETLKQLMDATLYAGPGRIVRAPSTSVSDFKTHELIMELLSRGFAVIKTPESGTPDVLTK